MTLEELFLLFIEYRGIIVGLMLIAPWLSWLICIVIPGKREEPFVLNLNLGLALLIVLGEIGYILYATNTGGWSKVVREADLLLLLAPLYYVTVSLWLTRQRLPLSQLRAFRILQGVGMIAGAYLLLSWIESKIRLVLFSYLPFGFLLLLLASLVGLAYLGYLRIRGNETGSGKSGREGSSHRPQNKQLNQVEDELSKLRRQMKRRKKR